LTPAEYPAQTIRIPVIQTTYFSLGREMASSAQFTGMAGVYLVAAELSLRGFITSPTSRSAHGADLLVAGPRGSHAFAVEVKTNATTFGFWLLNAGATEMKSESLIYALVNLRKSGPEFYLVPSQFVARHVVVSMPSATRKGTWHSIYLNKVEKYRDNWGIFGNPGLPVGRAKHVRKAP
jgi:hypothetical protein